MDCNEMHKGISLRVFTQSVETGNEKNQRGHGFISSATGDVKQPVLYRLFSQ